MKRPICLMRKVWIIAREDFIFRKIIKSPVGIGKIQNKIINKIIFVLFGSFYVFCPAMTSTFLESKKILKIQCCRQTMHFNMIWYHQSILHSELYCTVFLSIVDILQRCKNKEKGSNKSLLNNQLDLQIIQVQTDCRTVVTIICGK